MGKKLTYDYVKIYIESHYEGSKLLSKEYINIKEKLLIRCPFGHEFKMSFDSFKRGYRCQYCAKNAPLTTEFVYSEFAKRGYTVVSGEYKNARSKFKYYCNKHNTEIQVISWNGFQSGRGCKFCKIETIKSKQRLDRSVIEYEFTIRNLRMIDINDYDNAHSIMRFECNLHKGIIQEIEWNVLRYSKYGCEFCAKENNPSYRSKYDIEFSKEVFDNYGFILLEDEYINVNTRMRYKCKKHPEKIQYASLSSVLSNKARCKKCYKENCSAENSHRWKGGITSLRKFAREILSNWIRKSFEIHGYKCIVSGYRGELRVHHLYPFHKILNESMEILNFNIYPRMESYTLEEQLMISDKIIELHNKYGYGIPLHLKLHKLFHSTYGYKNFNKKHFIDFINRLYNHDFDEYLINNNIRLLDKNMVLQNIFTNE